MYLTKDLYHNYIKYPYNLMIKRTTQLKAKELKRHFAKEEGWQVST